MVTRREGSVELVEGQKLLWIAEQACLEDPPVVVESLSEREQAARFAFAHFPLPHDVDGAGGHGSELYSDADVQRSLERYVAVLGEEALEIYPVQLNAERLDMSELLASTGD